MAEEPLDRIEAKIDHLISQVGGLDTRVHRLIVMNEDMQDDLKRIADGVSGAGDRFDRIERSVDEIKSTMNSFIQTQSAINGKLRSRDADHERRIVALEKRPS